MLNTLNHTIALFVYALASKNIWTESFAILLSEGLLVLAFVTYVFTILPLRRSGAYARTVFHDIAPAAITALFGYIAKYFIAAPRPYVVLPLSPLGAHTDPLASFPSLHVAVITAFATTIYFAHPKLGKYIVAMVPFVMLGRIAVGAHWFTDVVAGALLGIVIALLIHYSEGQFKKYGAL